MNCEQFEISLQRLQQFLDYEFKNIELLITALTHKSFANETSGRIEDNQRLEFLGDAVLGMITAEALMEKLKGAPEGVLTQHRAAIVNEGSLADTARSIELGNALRLGRGEELSNGRDRSSTLCDAFEAVLGSIFLDGGFYEARRVIRTLISNSLTEIEDGQNPGDVKSVLQEFLHASNMPSPCYRLVGEEGPDHSKIFEVEISVEGKPLGVGKGRSKKEAEKDAAVKALKEVKL